MTWPLCLRKAAVRFYADAQNMRRVARLFNVSLNSVHRWVKSDGDLQGRTSRRSSRVTNEIVSAVRALLTAEPFLTPTTLCARIEQTFDVSLSRKLCYCAIRRAGLTYKRAKKRPKLKPGRRETERERFRAEIAGRDDSSIIFIDEVGFRDTLSPLYGYAPSGEPLIAVAGSTSWKHTTAIVAISASRVVGMKLLEGAAKKETFAPFIESLDTAPGQTLVMDNVKFHKSPIVRAAMAAKGLEVVYTPTADPDFNPIENAFGIAKGVFRRDCSVYAGAATLPAKYDRIRDAFRTLTPAVLTALVQRARSFWSTLV